MFTLFNNNYSQVISFLTFFLFNFMLFFYTLYIVWWHTYYVYTYTKIIVLIALKLCENGFDESNQFLNVYYNFYLKKLYKIKFYLGLGLQWHSFCYLFKDQLINMRFLCHSWETMKRSIIFLIFCGKYGGLVQYLSPHYFHINEFDCSL